MNFKKFESAEKLRGGYYTPADLATFLARWVSKISPNRTLEPSCGDGIFFEAINNSKLSGEIVGFELDEAEAQKSQERAQTLGLSRVNIRASDFLGWALEAMDDKTERFDAVIGNPPFIRYQYLPALFQDRAQAIFDRVGCKFTKHTNAWVSFVLASFELLRPGGRLAMVVPSEIIHVMHAQSLRSYLGANARRLIVVDPEELWFDGTLQGAVLLLVEKKKKATDYAEGLGIYPVRGRDFLQFDPEDVFNTPQSINGKTVEGKWTRALLAPATRELLDELIATNLARRFDEVADVDVGIVTGANKFFLVEDETVQRFGLQKWAYPMFGRSEHCPGIIYDDEQHQANASSGKPTNFIWFKDTSVERTKLGKQYIEQGLKESLHTRYKCRIRSPWYAVPSVYSTEIGMLKRSHDTPRLILNKVGAYTTDTAYRIRAKEGTAEQLVYSFLNGLTALSAELEGRHYGGGVLELVPSEIEKLLLPPPSKITPEIDELDKAVRTMSMDDVLALQTKRVLGEVGLSIAQQDELLSGWQRLRNRRHRVSSEAT
ncbi:Eco57I restriction-modification methylase domain-containing protein [Acetobacter syzygii]|uniref:Eco57I restriction-modification methylase domain-containing protein n=2 Tax=Acetobacter syzygii TaxID=146476 RepID=UPI0005E85268|nr:N-6 DNA methylase [Acetobacter syzygii]GAN72211.1 methyltransferase [Acetobacter syzygii]GBR64473.1 adenine-specific DNA methylase [Acetobacter syzygii NRIC 0483]